MTISGDYDPYDDDLEDNFDDAEFNTQELPLKRGGLWTEAPPVSDGEEELDDDNGYVSPVRDVFASLIVLSRNKKADGTFLTLVMSLL